MSIVSMCNKTGTIYQPTFELDDAGGTIENWGIGTTIRCRVMQASGREGLINGEVSTWYTHRIYVPGSYDLSAFTEAARIVVSGKDYQVIRINDVDLAGRLWQIDCIQRSPEVDG